MVTDLVSSSILTHCEGGGGEGDERGEGEGEGDERGEGEEGG